MADITMCMNDKCSKKNTCYRFNAKPAGLQSYSDFKEGQDCYWERKNLVKEGEVMKGLEEKYILNEAVVDDWVMHKSTKPVQVAGKVDAEDELVNELPNGTEFIVIRNYKSDKEKEFSVIAKDDNKYYFVTNTKTFI